jgi:hypothetical protein
MSDEQKKQHKDGPPWDSVRVFSSFEEANTFRATFKENKELQVKIKKYVNGVGESVFVVKKRRDPKLEQVLVVEKKKNKR